MRLRSVLPLLLAVLAASSLHAGDGGLEELDELRLEASRIRADALATARLGVEALEKGDAERGAALLGEAAAATSRLAPLSARARVLTAAIVRETAPLLDADDFAKRERATERLCGLDPRAVAFLESARPALGLEGRHRLEQVLAVVKAMDELGRLHQWAASARASTEYSDTNWSADQATGEPDTFQNGDLSTAWASREPDRGPEWLELDYATPVRAIAVRVHETFNPGAVAKVEAALPDGTWTTLWEGKDPTRVSPGWFEAAVTTDRPIRRIRVTLDSAGVTGWNEIDAVELVGRPGPGR